VPRIRWKVTLSHTDWHPHTGSSINPVLNLRCPALNQGGEQGAPVPAYGALMGEEAAEED